jgi:hypothetical protein
MDIFMWGIHNKILWGISYINIRKHNIGACSTGLYSVLHTNRFKIRTGTN